jgi:hypothetical protein
MMRAVKSARVTTRRSWRRHRRGCSKVSWKRTANYSGIKDEALIKAWEYVSLNAMTGTDQTGKHYWQQINEKFSTSCLALLPHWQGCIDHSKVIGM